MNNKKWNLNILVKENQNKLCLIVVQPQLATSNLLGNFIKQSIKIDYGESRKTNYLLILKIGDNK